MQITNATEQSLHSAGESAHTEQLSQSAMSRDILVLQHSTAAQPHRTSPERSYIQLQDMQQQQQQANMLLDAAQTCTVMLQDGSILQLTGQQDSAQGSYTEQLVVQPTQQQQQPCVFTEGMGASLASTSSTPLLVLQGSAGAQQLQQPPLPLGLYDQQQLLMQQPQVLLQQQQLPQQQMVMLASGEQLVCYGGPMQQQSPVVVAAPLAYGASSMGQQRMQLQQPQGSLQWLPCAGQQQVVMCAEPAIPSLRHSQVQGSTEQVPVQQQVVVCQQSSTSLVTEVHNQPTTSTNMQGQVVQVQTAEGFIVQGTIVVQVGRLVSAVSVGWQVDQGGVCVSTVCKAQHKLLIL